MRIWLICIRSFAAAASNRPRDHQSQHIFVASLVQTGAAAFAAYRAEDRQVRTQARARADPDSALEHAERADFDAIAQLDAATDRGRMNLRRIRAPLRSLTRHLAQPDDFFPEPGVLSRRSRSAAE
jgi:hypothetical protein